MFVERKIEENCLFSKILTLGHMFAAFQAGDSKGVCIYLNTHTYRLSPSTLLKMCVLSSANLFSNPRMFRSWSVEPSRAAALQWQQQYRGCW